MFYFVSLFGVLFGVRVYLVLFGVFGVFGVRVNKLREFSLPLYSDTKTLTPKCDIFIGFCSTRVIRYEKFTLTPNTPKIIQCLCLNAFVGRIM